MLLWENREDVGLAIAKVYAYAIDGTPVLMFSVAAAEDYWEIDDAQGHVLAREVVRSDGTMVANQVHAQAALRELLARLTLSA